MGGAEWITLDGGLEEAALTCDADLWPLCRRAAAALRDEDAALGAAMRGGCEANYLAEARHGTAPGLTYPVYETTLAYFIFRAWAANHHVRWDWDAVGGERDRRKLDLVVCDKTGPRYAFEAKWWNTVKAGAAMRHDVARLTEWRNERRSERRAFALAFWWTVASGDEIRRYEDDAKRWIGGVDLALRYRARFATNGPALEARFFYMDVMEVT
jgi:hypothetical protein